MGNQNTRYVIAFEFDDLTATEPVLEVWDDNNFNSIDSIVLGQGIASSSWFKGITTTTTSPGTNWVGSPLAGSANGNFLSLNGGLGALDVAKTLYANLKVVIPATQTVGTASFPILVCKYATN
jgi:hypothetical protein